MRVLHAASALALLLLSACTVDNDRRVLKLGHSLDVAHPVHQALEALADDLARRSGGRLGIDIYPSEQLGSERECVELLQIGSLAMTKTSASVMEGFAPSFRVFGLPYLFADADSAWAALDGPVGQRLLLDAERYRLRGLAYYDAGSRSFYTRERPIQRPEDLDGLKIRVQESATAMAMVSALGGSPTPISWGELYTALQQGVVDGAENNPPSFHLSRHYEVARYYTLDEHTRVPDVLLISTVVWQRLDDDERRWLSDAAVASAVRQRQLWRDASIAALDAVRADGVEVIVPDPQPFRSRVDKLYKDLRRDQPELAALVDELRAAS